MQNPGQAIYLNALTTTTLEEQKNRLPELTDLACGAQSLLSVETRGHDGIDRVIVRATCNNLKITFLRAERSSDIQRRRAVSLSLRAPCHISETIEDPSQGAYEQSMDYVGRSTYFSGPLYRVLESSQLSLATSIGKGSHEQNSAFSTDALHIQST